MKLAGAIAVFEALDSEGVRYIIVGGLAVLAHGYLRYTNDIDLVIQLIPENIQRTFRALGALGYRPLVPVTAEQFSDRQTRERWIREKHMRVLSMWSPVHVETPVDLFVTEPFDFDKEFDAAYRKPLLDRREVRVLAIPALIAMKEAAGRSIDIADIENLRRIQDELEQA